MKFLYPPSSSVFATILILTITISTTTAQGDDDQDPYYSDCSRQQIECGDSTFGFPFWGNNRPRFCGLPEFNLTCADDRTPTISIAGLTYQILKINSDSQILTLLQTDYAGDLCPADPQNVTDVDNLFDFTDDNEFLSLYYGCSSPATLGLQLPRGLDSFNCPSSQSVGGYFQLTESAYGEAIRNWLGLCSNRVRVPVNRTGVGLLEREPTVARLTATIEQGFGMRWTANDSLCATCRTSGGQCGFNETTRSFTCYCVDQPYGEACVPPATAPTAAERGTLSLTYFF
ncbi:LEAF RUST 10 DISEASE-RESISTANCE LOCUS RECEPTOR-LIKE PROTEIN KINASE-like 2.1 [Linum grandiflorum]